MGQKVILKKRWVIVPVSVFFAFLHYCNTKLSYDIWRYPLYHLSPNLSLYNEAGYRSYKTNRLDRVKYIISIGADPNAVYENRKNNATEEALIWSNAAPLNYLLSIGGMITDSSILKRSCKTASKETVRVLLKYHYECE